MQVVLKGNMDKLCPVEINPSRASILSEGL